MYILLWNFKKYRRWYPSLWVHPQSVFNCFVHVAWMYLMHLSITLLANLHYYRDTLKIFEHIFFLLLQIYMLARFLEVKKTHFLSMLSNCSKEKRGQSTLSLYTDNRQCCLPAMTLRIHLTNLANLISRKLECFLLVSLSFFSCAY